ncbi:hypothetical protein RHGRI_025543 [Rhododendron griersonianum]|uniref:Uncharacterized protein n=1 Tax=Rhododendron griersonianum TaxID=479676 RepID=A0AAV6IVL5_9ERIC|nr:hypothetical protein RHGRI_025543 [Rhododendron griersonianum]
MGSLEQINGESDRTAAFDVKNETPTNNTLEGFDIENQQQQLLWVILIGLIFAFIIQSLAAKLGVCTGKHLSELCKAEYPIFVKYCLWLLAEVAVIAADIPEAIMVFTMAASFFAEMSFVKPPAADLLKGLFVPKLSGQTATGDAIALLGALIMPHNLFLHSALVLSRKIPNSVSGVKEVCRYYLMETGFALFVALLINIAVTSVSATVCSDPNLSDQCDNITLNSASFLLKIIVVSWILGLAIMGANIYYLSTSFVGWMIHSTLPKAATVLIAIIVFPMMVVYVASVIYLMWRKDTVVTYIDTTNNDPAVQSGSEDGEDSIVPYREDLADIPLPE